MTGSLVNPVNAPLINYTILTNLRLGLDQFSDDWIVSGGDSVEDPVNALQWLLILHVHPKNKIIVI
jgi:hypothetical protein